jgi:hypothetical protein
MVYAVCWYVLGIAYDKIMAIFTSKVFFLVYDQHEQNVPLILESSCLRRTFRIVDADFKKVNNPNSIVQVIRYKSSWLHKLEEGMEIWGRTERDRRSREEA